MEFTLRQAYDFAFRELRAFHKVYDAYDKNALHRVRTFNYLCQMTKQPEAIDGAFRSWEALGIHRPYKPTFEAKRALHYRQLTINL